MGKGKFFLLDDGLEHLRETLEAEGSLVMTKQQVRAWYQGGASPYTLTLTFDWTLTKQKKGLDYGPTI